VNGIVAYADDELFARVNGTEFPVQYWVNPIFQDSNVVGGVLTFFDIAEQLQFKSQVLRSSMQPPGRRTGGIAHELQNALAVIAGYTSLLDEQLLADEVGRKYLQQIGIATERAACLTHQLIELDAPESCGALSLTLDSVVVDSENMLPDIARSSPVL
jgi:signal transduction histidine kinase